MRLDIYLNYRGNCEQAFRFYEQHLGGRITGIVSHGERPNPSLPADWQEKLVHARLEIGTRVLMGADISCFGRPRYQAPQPRRGRLTSA